VALVHLHLRQANRAARAPRHGVVSTVDELPVVALLEERPDGVVVLLRHREVAAALVGAFLPVVAAVPVHPVAQADRLLRLPAGKLIDALLAERHEAVDAGEAVAGDEALDVALGAEAQLLLDLDLDPEALAVEAVLVAQLVAGHGVVALVNVLVGAAPGVVDAHRVVGGDPAVEEGPLRLAAVLLAEALEGLGALPEGEDGALQGREVYLRVYLLERHVRNLAGRWQSGYLIIGPPWPADVRRRGRDPWRMSPRMTP